MQLHLPHPESGWQPWALGIAIVLGLLAAPIALALIWLAVVNGVLL